MGDEVPCYGAEAHRVVTEAGVLAELERIMCMSSGSISIGATLESLGRWDSLAVVEFIAFARRWTHVHTAGGAACNARAL